MENDLTVNLSAYLPILVLAVLAVLMAAGTILISALLGPQRSDRVKEQPYESGMPALGGGRLRLSIEYYLMAIIFLAFDVEVLFLFPWSLIYGWSLNLGYFILLEMLVFFAVLLAGYFYGWREGAYEWA